MKARTLICVALVVIGLGYYPLRAQQPPVPVTTPAAAETPNDKPAPNVPATEAVPVQQVPSPAAPTHAQDQVLWALIVSYAIQYLKNAHWFPVSSETSDRAKAAFGFLCAAATAAGIHFAVTGDVLDGGATLTISGISLDAFKDIAFQWAAQQGWFDLITHKRV